MKTGDIYIRKIKDESLWDIIKIISFDEKVVKFCYDRNEYYDQIMQIVDFKYEFRPRTHIEKVLYNY